MSQSKDLSREIEAVIETIANNQERATNILGDLLRLLITDNNTLKSRVDHITQPVPEQTYLDDNNKSKPLLDEINSLLNDVRVISQRARNMSHLNNDSQERAVSSSELKKTEQYDPVEVPVVKLFQKSIRDNFSTNIIPNGKGLIGGTSIPLYSTPILSSSDLEEPGTLQLYFKLPDLPFKLLRLIVSQRGGHDFVLAVEAITQLNKTLDILDPDYPRENTNTVLISLNKFLADINLSDGKSNV